MKKRWLSLYVENDVGVLAHISGLFAGKSYNMNSLTVGPTEDETVSRMTIGLISDDKTYEQIIKQLNRCVEVIKVLDFTDTDKHLKELMFIKISDCTSQNMTDIFRIAQVFGVKVLDCDMSSVILECAQSEEQNDKLVRLMTKSYFSRVEVVRGGSVGVEKVLIRT